MEATLTEKLKKIARKAELGKMAGVMLYADEAEAILSALERLNDIENAFLEQVGTDYETYKEMKDGTTD